MSEGLIQTANAIDAHRERLALNRATEQRGLVAQWCSTFPEAASALELIANEFFFQEDLTAGPQLPSLRFTALMLAVLQEHGSKYRIVAQSAAEQSFRNMSYRDYLATERWQNLRREALDAAGNRCQVCNHAAGELNAHHRSYDNKGKDPEAELADLVILCRFCHSLFHGRGMDERS